MSEVLVCHPLGMSSITDVNGTLNRRLDGDAHTS
jgi:hypothetical protein